MRGTRTGALEKFFAVVSEYFFNPPDLLQEKHPALFAMLERMFLKRE
jgi:Mlc titration factor MtfA (ptsG expression regulator)